VQWQVMKQGPEFGQVDQKRVVRKFSANRGKKGVLQGTFHGGYDNKGKRARPRKKEPIKASLNSERDSV